MFHYNKMKYFMGFLRLNLYQKYLGKKLTENVQKKTKMRAHVEKQ